MSKEQEFADLLHREMEQFIDEGYAELDQKEHEMRELGLIMYGDSSHYIINPEEYEKDKKICELENEVEELREKLHKCMPYEDAQEFEDFIRNSEKEKYNKQIADLEAKLAESENKVKGFVELFYKKQHENYEQFCEIQQLKQQLAEKDQTANNWQSMYNSVMKTCANDFKEIERLRKKLAEKEKELHYKTAECEKWKADYENCSKLEKTMSKEHQYCLDNWRASDQDKISFCVEQLEKVKEEAKHYGYEFSKSMHEYIDNQIKQLKEGK